MREVKELLRAYDEVDLQHVRRELNTDADALVNAALDAALRLMILWRACGSIFGVWNVFQSSGLDFRLIALGALLPLAIDAPFGGQSYAHTLLSAVLLLTIAMVATMGRGHRLRRRRALSFVIGWFAGLVLGGAWTHKEVFWWPAFGWARPDAPLLPPLPAPRRAGAARVWPWAAWIWVRFGLADPAAAGRVLRTGPAHAWSANRWSPKGDRARAARADRGEPGRPPARPRRRRAERAGDAPGRAARRRVRERTGARAWSRARCNACRRHRRADRPRACGSPSTPTSGSSRSTTASGTSGGCARSGPRSGSAGAAIRRSRRPAASRSDRVDARVVDFCAEHRRRRPRGRREPRVADQGRGVLGARSRRTRDVAHVPRPRVGVARSAVAATDVPYLASYNEYRRDRTRGEPVSRPQ